MPYFFSDLADWVSMEYVGPGSGDPVVRGSMDDGEFSAFYLDDGRVTAALSVGPRQTTSTRPAASLPSGPGRRRPLLGRLCDRDLRKKERWTSVMRSRRSVA